MFNRVGDLLKIVKIQQKMIDELVKKGMEAEEKTNSLVRTMQTLLDIQKKHGESFDKVTAGLVGFTTQSTIVSTEHEKRIKNLEGQNEIKH